MLPVKFELFRKLFQDELHLQNIERIMMASNQQQKTIYELKTEWSIPCKSQTPSGPYTPLYGTLKFWVPKVVFFVYNTG